MTDGGVRCGHVIEPVGLIDIVVQGAPHNEPHHHFDALGAGLPHVFQVRDLGQFLKIARQPVQEPGVPIRVDESAPLAVNLVRHPSRPQHDHAQILRVLPDGFANRPAQTKTPPAGRRRIGHHVHTQGDNRAGPPVGLAEQ